MSEPTLQGVTIDGYADLLHVAPIVTLLIFIILGLCWFIKSLLQDAKCERKLNRDALMANTAVIAEFKEIIRAAIHR